jgi:hypothetical protein
LGAGFGGASSFVLHAGQHFGQYVPRWKMGWCIFSARPPQLAHGASTMVV